MYFVNWCHRIDLTTCKNNKQQLLSCSMLGEKGGGGLQVCIWTWWSVVLSSFITFSGRILLILNRLIWEECEVPVIFFPFSKVNWLFNVTINDISVTYVTAHRCAGGLKKKFDLRSGSQRHRHFVGFFNVPVLAPTRDQPFYTVIPTHRPI